MVDLQGAHVTDGLCPSQEAVAGWLSVDNYGRGRSLHSYYPPTLRHPAHPTILGLYMPILQLPSHLQHMCPIDRYLL